jgi:TonB family protein
LHQLVRGRAESGERILAACLENPLIARAAHISGTVTVRVIIDTEGNVIAAAAIEGHPLLQKACLIAARNSRFTPALYDGKPAKVTGDIHYNFVTQ